MHRNITILLLSWLCALCASGTDYTGTLTIGSAEEQVSKEGVVITINQNADGTYTALVHDLSISYQGQTFDMGTVTFNNLEGTPDGEGYTKVSGIKEMRVSDIGGIESLIPETLQPYMSGVLNKTFPINFTARFNEKEITIFTDNDDSIDIGMTSGKDIRDSCSISVGLRKLRAGDRKGHIVLGDTRAGRRLNGNGVATDRTLRGGQIVLSLISGTGVHVEHLDIDGCGSTGNRKGSLNLLRLAGGEHSY